MKTITKAGAFILAGVLLLTAGCGNNEVETQQSPLVKTITVGEKDSDMLLPFTNQWRLKNIKSTSM